MGRRVPVPLLNTLLATRPAVYIGELSYALYLWRKPTLKESAVGCEHGD